MKQMLLSEKYPIFVLDVMKSETTYTSVEEILKFFREKIEAHPTCRYIGEFDHYSHTIQIGGEINPEIKDCKLIIFCFGNKLPDGKLPAVRPRSIGVTEYRDKFEISFLEAPALIANEVMEGWVKELRDLISHQK
ncbi:MAG: DUF6858 family protein [Campylobacterales bacterium]